MQAGAVHVRLALRAGANVDHQPDPWPVVILVVRRAIKAAGDLHHSQNSGTWVVHVVYERLHVLLAFGTPQVPKAVAKVIGKQPAIANQEPGISDDQMLWLLNDSAGQSPKQIPGCPQAHQPNRDGRRRIPDAPLEVTEPLETGQINRT